jgi:membrane-bound lytic murein transglycosylase D
MAAKFKTAVEAIPEEMRVYWRYHRVENGETLSDIARRYHTTATAIAEANNLEGGELARNSKLIIPVSPVKTTAAAPSETGSHSPSLAYSKRPARYTVRKGDTVLSVADDFGVPVEKVRQWNHLQGNALRAGRSLTIFKPAGGAVVEPVAAAGNHRLLRTGASHTKTYTKTGRATHAEPRTERATRAEPKAEHTTQAAARGKGKGRDRRKAAAEASPAKSVKAKGQAKGPAKATPSANKKHRPRG